MHDDQLEWLPRSRCLTRHGEKCSTCACGEALAGIGGRVSGILASTRTADRILVIDGCPQECARRCMEQAGFSGFRHLKLCELGMQKGSSPCTAERLDQVVAAAAPLLAP